MSFFLKSALVAEVAGHAFMIGMGPDRCSQSGRQPFKQDGGNPDDHTLVHQLSGTDGGRYGLQSVRCVSGHNDSAVDKLANWCKDAQGVSEAAYKVATADQAMCYAATPNTFTWNQNGPNTGAPNGFPTLGYGKDQSCDWQANDTIKVAVQVTAQHWGTHYIDMIPQNKKQVDDLPKCEFTKNRIKDFKPCVQPNVIPENTHNGDLEEWQRSTIRLHPAFAMHWTEEEASKDPTYDMKFFDTSSETAGQPSSDSSYRIEYQFPMPALGEEFFEKDTPAVFRWVWFCGWDVETNCSADNSCKGQVTHPGMGEIFVTCADISSVANCKGSECHKPQPRPTTTSGPVTTSNNTTTAPGPAPKPDSNCKFVGNWRNHNIVNKDVGSSVSQDYANWCAAATKGNKSKISDFVKDAFKSYGCCVAGAGPGPAPKPETTTSAPTTSHDVTTGPSTTTGPIPEGDRCVGEPFANTCKGRCQAHCNSKYGAVAKNQCWGYEEGHPGSEFILCVCGNDGEKDGPVVLSGCECHREGGCQESTMLLL
jgi:hypothetical protein